MIFQACNNNNNSFVHFTNLSKVLPSVWIGTTSGRSNWSLSKKDSLSRTLLDKCKGTVLNPFALMEADTSQCTLGKFCQAQVVAFVMCFAKEQKTAWMRQVRRGSQDSKQLISCSSLEISRAGGCSAFFKRAAFIFISATLHIVTDRYVAR